jgi:signal transduction histidine kinase
MFKYVRRVIDWGIHPNTLPEYAFRLRLTNALLLFMFFASIGQTLLYAMAGANEAARLNSTAPLLFGSSLLFIKFGYTKIGRVLVVTVSNIAAFVLLTGIGPESYFQFILLFSSGFSIIFFVYDRERVLFFYALIMPLIAFAVLEFTGYEPVLGMKRETIPPFHLALMRVGSIILIWGMIAALFVYFVRLRRQSQEQLVSSAKMVAVGRMAAGIAHEVNNPLQQIVLHADRLKELADSGTISAGQLSELSDQIHRVVMRIGSIVKGLLALSRDASKDPRVEVPFQKVLNLSLEYCRSRLAKDEIELRMSPFDDKWTVFGRETQLSEVLINVINNAADALSGAREKWVGLEAEVYSDSIEIVITDSGPGIEPEVQSRIFDPFFTTKAVGKGTGLGLSVSQAIMVDHGGQIFYDAEAPQTRFVIRIPRGQDLAVV